MLSHTTIWNAEDDLMTLFTTSVTLSPTQQTAANKLIASLATDNVCLLQARGGMGKTTVLRWLHARLGGVFLAARQWLASSSRFDQPSGSLVFVDGLHLSSDVKAALRQRKSPKLVFSLTQRTLRSSMPSHEIRNFTAQDYSVICHRYLGSVANHLDMAQIHAAAPSLSAQQLKHACLRLSLQYDAPSTSAFISLAEAVGFPQPKLRS